MRILTRHLALLALFFGAAACGGSSDSDPGDQLSNPVDLNSAETASVGQAPDTIEVPVPDDPVLHLERVEDLTEEVADWLLEFSDKLRRRDASAALDWLGDDFYGHGLDQLEVAALDELVLGARRTTWKTDGAPILGRGKFLASVMGHLGTWERVDNVLWKVKGAEFQKGRRPWCDAKLFLRMLGVDAGGGRVSITGWAHARATKRGGRWWLERFRLDELYEIRREAPLFSDVSASSGVAHTWARFGTDTNRSYAWNGAAGGDIDGDGDWDLFLPSDGRNYLYLAQPDGTYREEAETRGVAQPEAGTGPVLADFDNDGDQDLFVAHVGWREADGGIGGQLPQLYRNDGKGRFERAKQVPGLDAPVTGYHALALDYDQDGWLDLFICGYGRVEAEHNDSWIEATNGSPNALLRNLEGKGFENVTKAVGLADRQWSYAAAAADITGDGRIDLYVANDYGSNRLYSYQPDGTFLDIAGQLGIVDRGNGMGTAFGDLDGDGKLDLYVSNMSSTAGNRILGRLTDDIDPELYGALKKLAAGNTIFRAQDDGTFARVPSEAGGVNGNWAWSAALCDFDLDGKLDVFCTNGFVTGDLPHDT